MNSAAGSGAEIVTGGSNPTIGQALLAQPADDDGSLTPNHNMPDTRHEYANMIRYLALRGAAGAF